jgi:hypothetical protein
MAKLRASRANLAGSTNLECKETPLGRITFQKRQKEMKRQEKRQMKAERRAQRKLEKSAEPEAPNQQPIVPAESDPQAAGRIPGFLTFDLPWPLVSSLASSNPTFQIRGISMSRHSPFESLLTIARESRHPFEARWSGFS